MRLGYHTPRAAEKSAGQQEFCSSLCRRYAAYGKIWLLDCAGHYPPLIIAPAFICRTTGRACALVAERVWTPTMRCCDDDLRPPRPSRAPSRRQAAAGILADPGMRGWGPKFVAFLLLQRECGPALTLGYNLGNWIRGMVGLHFSFRSPCSACR